jgi:hypothetical protein
VRVKPVTKPSANSPSAEAPAATRPQKLSKVARKDKVGLTVRVKPVTKPSASAPLAEAPAAALQQRLGEIARKAKVGLPVWIAQINETSGAAELWAGKMMSEFTGVGAGKWCNVYFFGDGTTNWYYVGELHLTAESADECAAAEWGGEWGDAVAK